MKDIIFLMKDGREWSNLLESSHSHATARSTRCTLMSRGWMVSSIKVPLPPASCPQEVSYIGATESRDRIAPLVPHSANITPNVTAAKKQLDCSPETCQARSARLRCLRSPWGCRYRGQSVAHGQRFVVSNETSDPLTSEVSSRSPTHRRQ